MNPFLKYFIILILFSGALIYLWDRGPSPEELAAREKASAEEVIRMEREAQKLTEERAKECEQDPVRCAIEDAYEKGYEEGYEAGLEAAYESSRDFDDDRDYDPYR